jgi:hypothetical protein
MPFITQGKTNWKLLLIVIVLAAVVVGFSWWLSKNIFIEGPLIKPTKPDEKYCEKDSDCVLNYTGSETCPSCLSDDYQCVSLEYYNKVLWPEWEKNHKGILCEGCPMVTEKLQCICEKSLCKKIVKDETADWKTYRNEEYDFEIKYPKEWNNYPDWEARKGWSFVSGQVSFSPFTELELEKGEGAGFVVSVLNSSDIFTSMGWINPSELAARELIEKEREIFKDEYGEAKFKITDENLNGLPVVKEEISKLIMDGKEGSVVDYYINNGNRKFVIGYAGSVQEVNNNLATFNQMLSTFKFIEPYIKVISPNGGEEWKVGNTYDITWEAAGIDEVFIHLYVKTNDGSYSFSLNPTDSGKIYPNGIDAKLGTFSWKITKDSACMSEASQMNKFKIQVTSPPYLDPAFEDESDNYFSIIPE